MITLILLIIGGVIGFLLNIITMKINFKQRTIENKIKIYDSLISSWVKMRNLIYNKIEYNTNPSKKWDVLDQIYGETQTFIAEIFLVSDNTQLAQDINIFNENFIDQNGIR
jgi:hypothetical protein